MPPLPQHADEASFLWLLRSKAVWLPHYRLKDLGKLDGRVEAHVDALRIGADDAWELCKENLEAFPEPGEAFAAASVAFESGKQDRIDHVFTHARDNSLLRPAIVSALAWDAQRLFTPRAASLAQSTDPLLQHLALATHALLRTDPGPLLAAALKSPDAPLRARALKAVGELRRADMLFEAQSALADKDPACAFHAAYSCTLLKHAAAIPLLRRLAESSPDPLPASSFPVRAAILAARAMPLAESGAWHRELTAKKLLRPAIHVAGASGDAAHIPWLLEQLTNPLASRLAGESISLITGVDLAYEDLDLTVYPEDPQGPTEDAEDDNTLPDPDSYLPWPDPAKLQAWWKANASKFPAGKRLLCVKPIDPAQAASVLVTGFQRQRRAAAIELALHNPKDPLANTAARADRLPRSRNQAHELARP